jgi:hypothetical protein
MQRDRRGKWALACLVWCFSLTSALGQERTSVLSQIPADAPIVGHIRGYERTKERIFSFLKTAMPDLAPMIQAQVEEEIKKGLEGRSIKGLPPDGSIFGVITELPAPGQGEPSMAVIFAVTDYKEFRDGYLEEAERKTLKEDRAAGYESVTVRGREVYMVDRKGYAVVTLQKQTALKFAGKFAGIDAKLPKETAKHLLESDAAVYVDMAAVNKMYGTQLATFRQLSTLIFQQAGGQTDKATADMMKAVMNGFFQFVEDSRGLLMGWRFAPEGVAMHIQARVGADTKVNALLKKSVPGSMTEIGDLPEGKAGYLASVINADLFKAFGPLFHGVAAHEDAGQPKIVEDLLTQLAAADPKQMIGDYDVPASGLSVWQYKDPGKVSEAYLKFFQALAKGETYGNMPLKEKPEVTASAQAHRDFKLHRVGMQWDFAKLARRDPQGGEEMAQAMKSIMGEETNVWFGSDGKTFVQVTAKEWDAAKKHLDSYLEKTDPVAKKPGFIEAFKQLPSPATMVMLVDGPQYLQAMLYFFGVMVKDQPVPFKVPPYKGPEGVIYVGMAVTLQPELGSFDMWIPAALVGEIRKIVEPIYRDVKAQRDAP